MKNRLHNTKKLDALIIFIFIIFITWQPFFLQGEINLFEVGLYLPGINTVLEGGQLFRDVFHLRGPVEIYIPALLMKTFGINLSILSIYFYIGTILTLLISVLIAKELLHSRLFLYLFSLVLVAKTFPRVVFTYWGGFRFAIGLLGIYCIVKFFHTKHKLWFYSSAAMVAISLLTSLEIGVAAGMAIVFSLLLASHNKKETNPISQLSWIKFIGLTLLFSSPLILYYSLNNALIPFLDSIRGVLFNMEKTFPQVESVPDNLWQVITGMLNPAHKNFRHLTPLYAYIFLGSYLFHKFRNSKFNKTDYAVIAVAGYGFIFFITSFRNIWSNNFEMMLQPEKIILFILVEKLFYQGKYFLKNNKRPHLQQFAVRFVLLGIIISSIAYPLARFNRRFFTYQFIKYRIQGKDLNELNPLSEGDSKVMKLERVKGMRLPLAQAQDLELLAQIINEQTASSDPVLFFPEYGALNFILDRPFIGRFPTVTLSWIKDQWHENLFTELKTNRPKVVVIPKEFPPYFERTQLQTPSNQNKYNKVRQWVETHYTVLTQTPTFNVYRLNKELFGS